MPRREDDAAWVPAARKFKSPDDYIVSALRACDLDGQADLALSLRLQGQLGQPMFQPRSPAGFGDIAAVKAAITALGQRIDRPSAPAVAMVLP